MPLGNEVHEHRLRKAFEWFDKRVADHLNKSTDRQGRRLAQCVEDLSERFFMVITLSDALNACKVFETRNEGRLCREKHSHDAITQQSRRPLHPMGAEKHLSGSEHNFASDRFNIEHVLAQNPQDGGETFRTRKRRRCLIGEAT
ncbi:MAG TPA: hypothetical protein PKY22_01790 [Accumulibacter sp.]|nr:hypothetical protein [Accumulibacter sp.]